MGIRLLILLVCLAVIAPAQDAQTPDRDYTVDCTSVAATLSCRSYNELIKAKDKDLLGHMQYQPFVCFVQNDDEFIVITTKRPPVESFRIDKDGASKFPAVQFLVSFKDGVQDNYRFIPGEWSKFTIDNQLKFFFQTELSADTQLSIDDSEIDASYQFTNLYHTTTSYTLKIRKSTKRFVETYEFPEPEQPAKKGEVPPKPSDSRSDDTGYCASFE